MKDQVQAAAQMAEDVYPEHNLLDYRRLREFCQESQGIYATAEPFPHILIEDFIDPETVDSILARFPSPEAEINWREITAADKSGEVAQANKQGMANLFNMPAIARQLIWELNSSTFIRILEGLVGIRNLLPDPGLRGGGLHQVLPGGVLGVHADFTQHAKYGLDRRVNLLIYLNKDWQDEYNGHLELWDKSLDRCVSRVRPLAGRCVIFNTDASSFHGHPRPLQCPEGMTRKSIALYYYSQGREGESVAATQATDWRVLPDVELPAPI